jgi:hypothetical protein
MYVIILNKMTASIKEQIRELLMTKQGREMLMETLYGVEREKPRRYRDWVRCPKCGRDGNWAVIHGYLVFWHWIKDEATGKKIRKWCSLGRVVRREEGREKGLVIFVIAGKWLKKQIKAVVEGEKEKNLENPPNATKKGD